MNRLDALMQPLPTASSGGHTLDFDCPNCSAHAEANLVASPIVVDREHRLIRTTTSAICPYCGCCIAFDWDYPVL